MAITFGSAGAPSQVTINLDALFATSLANYNKTLVDNIGTANAFWFMIMQNKAYESTDGGSDLRFPLMYALAPFDTYDGYDVLDNTPTDGITQAVHQWAQAATPIVISRKEERQNAQRIVELLKTKIQQSEIAIKEGLARHLLRGSGNGALGTPYVSAFNGSSGIDPLPKLVAKDPTTGVVGNIDPATNIWWRNQSKSSAATTTTGFLQEVQNLFNSCSKGPGGPPDLFLMDQTTYEQFIMAMYNRFRLTQSAPTIDFPFANVQYLSAKAVWDEFVPDVQNGTVAVTKGTLYMLNMKFFKVKYDAQSNFITSPFQKPTNQDAKQAHIFWMGATATNNRRKHGVLYNISQSLTVS